MLTLCGIILYLFIGWLFSTTLKWAISTGRIQPVSPSVYQEAVVAMIILWLPLLIVVIINSLINRR